MASLSTCAAGVFLMLVSAHIGSLPLMFFAFLCWGFGFGGTVPLGEFIWAKYFGRVHIGAVRAFRTSSRSKHWTQSSADCPTTPTVHTSASSPSSPPPNSSAPSPSSHRGNRR